MRAGHPSYGRAVLPAVGTLVAAWFAIGCFGVPTTSVLAGAWLLAAACNRVSGLSGPACWAAGIAGEYLLLVGGSAALALVSAREHGRLPNLALLAIPVLIGGLGVVLGRHRPSRPAHSGLAWSIMMTGLLVARWVAGPSGARGAAWAMSGDGRNHVLLVRNILSDGGITVRELRGYPALVNGISSVLSGADGRAGLRPGDLMLHDARSVADTFVLAAIGLGCLFAAALLELLPPAISAGRRLPLPVGIVGYLAAWLAASPVVLGLALHDGFLSAYGALPLCVAVVVLAQRVSWHPSPAAFALLGPITVMSLVAWSPLAIIPATLALTSAAALPVQRRVGTWPPARRGAWPAALIVTGGSLLVVATVTLSQGGRLVAKFRIPGSALKPEPALPLVLTLVAVAGLLAGRRVLATRLLPAVAAGTVGGATALWLRSLSITDEGRWSYYSSKMLWLVSAVLIWTALLPVLAAVVRHHRDNPPAARRLRDRLRTSGQAVAGSLAVILVLAFASPLSAPIPRAHNGWTAPSAAEIDEVRTWGNGGRPFVMWGWGSKLDDRLGNFWAALTWAAPARLIDFPYGVPNGPVDWAYANVGKLSQLCELEVAYPGLRVITRDVNLSARLGAHCAQGHPDVIVTG